MASLASLFPNSKSVEPDWHGISAARARENKSILVLFFKKELLAFAYCSRSEKIRVVTLSRKNQSELAATKFMLPSNPNFQYILLNDGGLSERPAPALF